MLPARQTSNSPDLGHIDDACQAVTGSIPEDGAFHVCRLDLATLHFNFTVLIDKNLGDVQGVSVSFRKTQRDRNTIRCCGIAYAFHFSTLYL